jgi:hypothetical protein
MAIEQVQTAFDVRYRRKLVTRTSRWRLFELSASGCGCAGWSWDSGNLFLIDPSTQVKIEGDLILSGVQK